MRLSRVNPAEFILLCAVALVYLATFRGSFQFDDYNVIVNNPVVHSWSAWFADLGHGIRPLLKASYTFNWVLSWETRQGEFGFHLFNIAVHGLNALLIYRLGCLLLASWAHSLPASRHPGAPHAVFFAALVFALHPLQTEAVTYISGRSVSLMAFFYLAAIVAYIGGNSPDENRLLRYASPLLFVLALAVKETAVTLPLILLLVEYCRSESPAWKNILRRQTSHWSILLLVMLGMALHSGYGKLLAFGMEQRGIYDNLLTQIGGIHYLLSRLVIPYPLNIDPPLPVVSAWSAVLAAQAGLLLTLLIAACVSLRRRPWIAFGVSWFFIILLPTNSVVPRLDVANERQLYLAGWGLLLAVSLQLATLQFNRSAIRVVAGAILLFLVGFNITRQLDYRSEITLWQASVAAAPHNPRAHNNLGFAYTVAGQHEAARGAFAEALRLRPDYKKARYNLDVLQQSQPQKNNTLQ